MAIFKDDFFPPNLQPTSNLISKGNYAIINTHATAQS